MDKIRFFCLMCAQFFHFGSPYNSQVHEFTRFVLNTNWHVILPRALKTVKYSVPVMVFINKYRVGINKFCLFMFRLNYSLSPFYGHFSRNDLFFFYIFITFKWRYWFQKMFLLLTIRIEQRENSIGLCSSHTHTMCEKWI